MADIQHPTRPTANQPANENVAAGSHGTASIPPGDGDGLFSNLVRRTDGDFVGVHDKSLIGHDLPEEDDEDEDGER